MKYDQLYLGTTYYLSMQGQKRQVVKVDKKEAEVLKKKAHEFDKIFQEEQAKFQQSQENEYYIVSTQYIEQWREFCNSNQVEREQPEPMNECLMDQAGSELKPDLSESQDFEIVNENIYNLLKTDRGFEIKRQAYMVGNEKKVQVYLSTIKYIRLDSKDLKGIDFKRILVKDLILKTMKVSQEATIEKVLAEIKKNERLHTDCKLRLWKNDKELTMEKLYTHIKEKCGPLTGTYRLNGIGKKLDDESHKISELELEEGDYFIVESIDQYSDWFFKCADESKCEGCYKYKKLPIVCGCKKVAYCTEMCQEKDKRYHLRDCAFAEEEELNKKVQMVMSPNSMLGRVGLSNLGNTCFMNSCLQCLSHTMPLTEYFHKSFYEAEINKTNVLGTKGKLAKSYAKFIKHMWCESESTFSPYNLKGAVSSINPMFSGYAQHDSQQFFSFIADGLHEDLNRIHKKPYIDSIESAGRQDPIVAYESWKAYIQRNQSIIVDLMTGQYKSKVVCPDCTKESITFDPFTTVSLPIPEETVPGVMKYFVIFNNCEQEAKKMSFQYKKSDQKEWLDTAAGLLKREPTDFVFYILTMYEAIYAFEGTSKAQILHKIQVENKNAFLLELSPEEKAIKNRVTFVTRLCKKTYYGDDYDNLWFKRPFFFQKNGLTGLKVTKRILEYLYYDVWDDSKKRSKNGKSSEDYMGMKLKNRPFTLVLKYKKTIERFYHRVELKFEKEEEIQDDTDITELMEKLKIEVGDCELDVRFTKDGYREFTFDRMKSFSDCLEKYSKSPSENVTVTLEQCFNVFEEKEKLEPGNEWYCSQCKSHKLATKVITLYKAPQILILHLKRFKSKGIIRKEKNQANVKFPSVLDISKYVIDPTPMSTYIPDLKKEGLYLNPSFEMNVDNEKHTQYELYAVSNHYGGLGGGHYTAYAKNAGKWFQFNDSSVREVSEDGIKGTGAYILFYRRKGGIQYK